MIYFLPLYAGKCEEIAALEISGCFRISFNFIKNYSAGNHESIKKSSILVCNFKQIELRPLAKNYSFKSLSTIFEYNELKKHPVKILMLRRFVELIF